jgi:hypothetical protein
MQIDRKKIEANLPKKGFVEEKSDHNYFYHEYRGRRTGAYTYTSFGSKYKVYPVELLKMMKFQLRLDTISQVVDLFKCPMEEADYNRILQDKGIITTT